MPKTQQEPGWKCPETGKLFVVEETLGYGYPPASPAWQAAHVGGGRGPAMAPVQLDVTRDDNGLVTKRVLHPTA